jgi:hypothetical protein
MVPHATDKPRPMRRVRRRELALPAAVRAAPGRSLAESLQCLGVARQFLVENLIEQLGAQFSDPGRRPEVRAIARANRGAEMPDGPARRAQLRSDRPRTLGFRHRQNLKAPAALWGLLSD